MTSAGHDEYSGAVTGGLQARSEASELNPTPNLDEARERVEAAIRRLRGFAMNASRAHGDVSAFDIRPEIITLLTALDTANARETGAPIPMVLHCPKCGLQHIDAPDPPEVTSVEISGRETRWDNPPHRSHLCHGCGHIWRPADVPTEGVAAIATKGAKDSPLEAAERAPGREEIKATLYAAILDQNPDAGWVATKPDLLWVSGGCTPQTAGAYLDLAEIADAILALGAPDLLARAQAAEQSLSAMKGEDLGSVSPLASPSVVSPSDGDVLRPVEGGGSGADRCIDNRPRHPDGGPDRWTCDGERHRGWAGHDPFSERCPKARK